MYEMDADECRQFIDFVLASMPEAVRGKPNHMDGGTLKSLFEAFKSGQSVPTLSAEVQTEATYMIATDKLSKDVVRCLFFMGVLLAAENEYGELYFLSNEDSLEAAVGQKHRISVRDPRICRGIKILCEYADADEDILGNFIVGRFANAILVSAKKIGVPTINMTLEELAAVLENVMRKGS